MAKYHVNGEGKVGICKASKRPCRFGDSNFHYNSREEAVRINSIKKSMPKTPQRGLPPILLTPNKINTVEKWDYSALENFKRHKNIETLVKEIVGGDDLPKTFDVIMEKYEKLTSSNYGKFLMELKDSYYATPNAMDEYGVLEHVREKGFDTSGLRPVDAVKKMLREENLRYLSFVENSKKLDVRVIDFNSFTKAERHFNNIEAIEPKVKSSNSKEFSGVLYQTPEGRMRLLDGHHRVKYKNQNGDESGLFLILSD